MKIAIAQLNYTIGDVDGNASKIIDSIHKAKAQHADLVIFAEQAVSGTPAFDLLRKTTFLELCEDALVEIASCCDGIAAIVGLPILTADGTISAAALIQDRKVLRYIGKKYITARREMGFLVPSKGYEYATIKGHKCAIIVGDDLSRERDFDQSVETVISINARKYGKGTMTYRYEMMRNLAFVESKNLVLVNQVGGSTDIVYDGTSGALNSRGELVLMMKNFEEDFQIFDTKASARPISIPSTYNDRTRLGYRAVKRAFDIVFSGCVLAVIAVPSLVLAAAIRLESEGNPFYAAASFRYDDTLSKAENREKAREFLKQVQRGDYFQMAADYYYGVGAHSMLFIADYDPETDSVHWADSNMKGKSVNGVRYAYVQYDAVKPIDWFVDAFCRKKYGATIYRLRDDIVYAE